MNHKREHRQGLPMAELIGIIRALLDDQRAIEQLLCRYLADLADRVDERHCGTMSGFSDIYHASRCLFGMSVRRTRERVRIGRALRSLPQIERAFVEGRLGYSRVRELTRVAQSDDEEAWLRLAYDLPMRVLEQRVAEASGTTHDRTCDPAQVRWTKPDTVQ